MNKIFEGLKVVEFTTGAVGPIMGRYLSNHGATVIVVESEVYPCVTRVTAPWKGNKPVLDKSGYFTLYYTNKLSLALNMQNPKALDVAKKLVAWADVVIETFAVGVMKRWGIDYQSAAKLNPDLIMISSSNAGQTGPFANQPAYGMHLNGLAGFSHLTGYADREPNNPSMAYSDFATPRLGICALIAALIHRRKTGEGQYLDHSQVEASAHFLAPLFLDYQASGNKPVRNGNRVADKAPHSAYRCKGEDRWCAIAVSTQEQWRGLCGAMGNASLSKDPRFATIKARKENEEILDSIIEAWTSKMTAEEVMTLLQSKGVPAGVVATMGDVYSDPQLAHRQFLRVMDHPDLGQYHFVAQPFSFSKTPAQLERSPRLGEHTTYVLGTLLDYSDAEIAELAAAGVLR